MESSQTNEGPRLAPSYDLLATVVYKKIKPRMAMKISNHIDFKFLTGITRYSQTSIFSAFTDYSPWQAKEVLT